MPTRNSAVLSSFCRFIFVSLLATGVIGAARLDAQTPIASRITAPLDDRAVVSLRGSVHPLARAEFDRGAAPVSLPAQRMLLILKRAPEQQQALEKYLATLQDPASPSYHKFLNPTEFGRLYGPSDGDVQTISTWLQGHGFQVNQVSKSRSAVEFSGNVGQVQDTFQTSIHSFMVRGEQHWANTTDPAIPAALAPVVAGLSPLNNFNARPNSRRGPSAVYDPATRKATPLLTSTSGGNFLYVGPADAATIYNVPNATLNANYSASKSFDGSGITIAVAGVSQIDPSNVANYRTLFGLAPNPPQVIVDGNDPGLTDAADEALLDLEIAAALAPGAKTILYTAASTTMQDGLLLAIARALEDNTASILNVSFGACESAYGTSGNQYLSSLWEQAAAQGISVTVSTGDSGPAGCDDPNSVTVAAKGYGVNAFASTPFNIAVGGTDYVGLASSFNTYASLQDRAGTHGSAIKYIPEVPWNDSPASNGKLAQNLAFLDSSGKTNIVAGSGGVSTVYSKPTWQKSATPADTFRDLPDVSLLAANGAYSATWAVCASQFVNAAGVTVTDCSPDAKGNYNLSGFGGTSTASPAFAGMLALVEQSVGHRLGQANVVLYKLAQTSPAVFHDITSGNISVVCTGGAALNCGTNGFMTGYDAGTGYDLATGLGSVDASAMVANWATAGLSSSATTLALSQTTFAHGTPVTINVGVSGSGGTPSGDVGIVTSNTAPTAGGLSSLTPTTTTNASGALTLGTSGTASTSYTLFPGGSYTVFANYGGDTLFSGSTSPGVSINVTPQASALMLSVGTVANNNLVNIANSAVPFGTYVSIDATPGPSPLPTSFFAAATGSVTFTDTPTPLASGTTAINSVPINSNGSAEVPLYSYAPGPHSISAAYSGDASFSPSSAGPVAFTVTDVALAATPASLALTAGQTKPVTLNLTPSNGFTGTVNLSCAITAGPASAASIPTCSIAPGSILFGTTAATATLTVATTAKTTASLHSPAYPGHRGWIASGSGALLACMFFFGIPAKRRNWRAISAVLFFVIAVSGCGGGGSSSSTPTPTPAPTPTGGTTAGIYTLTVTSSTNGPSGTATMHVIPIAVTVN